MKLNKKGTSLAELIVSIALVSIVMLFMFRLLIDVNNEQTNDTFAKDNQIIRAEIIKAIETDLTNKTLQKVYSSGSSSARLMIQFQFKEGSTAIITAQGKDLTYKNAAGETRKWTMNNCTLYTEKANVYIIQDSNIYSMMIDIEVHTNNDLNTKGHNNSLDDIALTVIGKKSDYTGGNLTMTCLGNATGCYH